MFICTFIITFISGLLCAELGFPIYLACRTTHYPMVSFGGIAWLPVRKQPEGGARETGELGDRWRTIQVKCSGNACGSALGWGSGFMGHAL